MSSIKFDLHLAILTFSLVIIFKTKKQNMIKIYSVLFQSKVGLSQGKCAKQPHRIREEV